MKTITYFAIVIMAAMICPSVSSACLGGITERGNVTLMASSVSVGDNAIPFPPPTTKNTNKKIDIPLVDRAGLKISVLYIQTTAKNEIVSTVYHIEQDGYEPENIQLKSNVLLSGVRTRSVALAPKPEEPEREPLPPINVVYGCGGAEGGSGSSGAPATR